MHNKLALVILAFLTAIPLAWSSDGSTIASSGGTSDITAFSVCKRVTNNNGLSLYVPTASAAEWSSFYNDPPGNVIVSACLPACSGYSEGGYCWYYGATAASCDTTCASHGACNLSATRDYAGSGGTNAHCTSVLTGISAPGTTTTDTASGASADSGCFYGVSGAMTGRYRTSKATTTCSGSYTNWRRACACNN